MGNPDTSKARIRVFASSSTWLEGEALRQLDHTASFAGMRAVAGMPDLHPGRGNPVGAAFLTEGRFYPHLVGNDIGCGMALFPTDLAPRKLKTDRAERALGVLDRPWDGDATPWLSAYDVDADPTDTALGTIGGGNHFAELQAVADIHDAGRLSALGLDASRLALLVHSGSRGYGEAVLRAHVAVHGAGGLAAGSEDARAYLAEHDRGVEWARANRAVIAHRFMQALRADHGPALVDVCHNCVKAHEENGDPCWLHRKGATPADVGPVVIPGSRGTLSYLVEPTGQQEGNLWSLPHGAGRKWARADAKGRLSHRYTPASLRKTKLGGRVVCNDTDLLYEEAPQAYKDVDRVVADLLELGLVRIIATLRPVLTFKTAGGRS